MPNSVDPAANFFITSPTGDGWGREFVEVMLISNMMPLQLQPIAYLSALQLKQEFLELAAYYLILFMLITGKQNGTTNKRHLHVRFVLSNSEIKLKQESWAEFLW